MSFKFLISKSSASIYIQIIVAWINISVQLTDKRFSILNRIHISTLDWKHVNHMHQFASSDYCCLNWCTRSTCIWDCFWQQTGGYDPRDLLLISVLPVWSFFSSPKTIFHIHATPVPVPFTSLYLITLIFPKLKFSIFFYITLYNYF